MGHSVLAVLQEYETEKIHKSQISEYRELQSVIFRFVAPGWGAPLIKGERMTLKEAEKIKHFLEKVSCENLNNILDTFNNVCNEKKIEKDLQRKKRYVLNKFVDWAITHNYIRDKNKSTNTPKWKADRSKGEKRFEEIQALEHDGVRGIYKPYSLGTCPGDYINPVLHKQVQECIKFGENKLGRTSKLGKDFFQRFVFNILGWLHREKGISLDEINFESLIPIINLNPSIETFEKIEDYWKAKTIATDKAKQEAKKVVLRMEEFFEWRASSAHKYATETKVHLMDLVIVIAKFLYREQTDVDEAINFEDVTFVRHLQVARTKISRQAKEEQNFKKIEKEANLVEWWEIWKVIHELKLRADATHIVFDYVRKSGTRKDRKEVSKQKRTPTAIANDVQNFILLAFFVIMPPDRQRTFRELSIGGTLKHGLFDKKGKFTPVSRLEYRNQAKYYIDLGKDEYKTSKVYGHWRGEIPNYIFPDGTNFYSYLDKWLYYGYQDNNGEWHGLRDFLKPQNHNFFFSQKNGKPFQKAAINDRFHSICGLFLQKRVNPHDLRHSFNTHLAEIGASQEERESAAYWMKHSLEMAKDRYEHVKMELKLEPARSLTQKGVLVKAKD